MGSISARRRREKKKAAAREAAFQATPTNWDNPVLKATKSGPIGRRRTDKDAVAYNNAILAAIETFGDFEGGINPWTGENVRNLGQDALVDAYKTYATGNYTVKKKGLGRSHRKKDADVNELVALERYSDQFTPTYVTDSTAITKNFDAARNFFATDIREVDEEDKEDVYKTGFLDSAKGVGVTSRIDVDALNATYGFNANAFRGYTDSGKTASNDSTLDAYNFLNKKLAAGDSIDTALSEWYGTSISTRTALDSVQVSGYFERNNSRKQLADASGIVAGIMEVTTPYAMLTSPDKKYGQILEDAYTKDPMVRAIYAAYGANPVQADKDGDVRWYDPFTGGTVQTVNTRPSKNDVTKFIGAAVTAVATAGVGAALGPAVGAGLGLTGGTATAVGTGITTAGLSALQGADAEDAIVSGILSGASTWAGEAATAADEAQAAVENAIKFEAGAEAIADLQATASLLGDQATLANAISQSGQALNALANEDALGALTAGLSAAGLSSPKEWVTSKVIETLDPQGTGLIAGRLDTQPFAGAAWKFSKGVLEGKDADSAMTAAIKSYVREGGTLNTGGAFAELLPDLPDDAFLAQFDSQTLDSIKQAIATAGSYIDDQVLQPVRGIGKEVDDQLLAPIKDQIIAAGGLAEELIDKLPTETLGDLVQQLGDAGSEFDDSYLQPIKNAILERLPNAEGLDLALPDVDVPWDTLLQILAVGGKATQQIGSTGRTATRGPGFSPEDVGPVSFEGKSEILQELTEDVATEDVTDMVAQLLDNQGAAEQVRTEERDNGDNRVQIGSRSRSNPVASRGRSQNRNIITGRRSIS